MRAKAVYSRGIKGGERRICTILKQKQYKHCNTMCGCKGNILWRYSVHPKEGIRSNRD